MPPAYQEPLTLQELEAKEIQLNTQKSELAKQIRALTWPVLTVSNSVENEQKEQITLANLDTQMTILDEKLKEMRNEIKFVKSRQALNFGI